MDTLYKFIDQNTIEAYSGDILKRYDGQNLIEVVSNPSDDDLKRFGYKPLVQGTYPEYNKETQYLYIKYNETDDSITEEYEVLSK